VSDSLLAVLLPGRFFWYKLEQFGAKGIFKMFRGEEAIFSYRKFVFIHGSPENCIFSNRVFCSLAPTELIICSARAGTCVPDIFLSLPVRCRLRITYLLLSLLLPLPPTPLQPYSSSSSSSLLLPKCAFTPKQRCKFAG